MRTRSPETVPPLWHGVKGIRRYYVEEIQTAKGGLCTEVEVDIQILMYRAAVHDIVYGRVRVSESQILSNRAGTYSDHAFGRCMSRE